MAETQAAPPADSGKIDVAAITKTVTDEVMKAVKAATEPLAGQLAELAKNQKVLADTYAADKAAADKAADDKAADKAAQPLTAEQVQKLVSDALAAKEQTAQSKAEREAFIASAESGLGKLPKTYLAKLGADKAKWAEEAKAIVAEFEADFKASGGKVPDVGGANREGGDTATGKPGVSKFANLTDGQRKFAESIKLPGQTTAA